MSRLVKDRLKRLKVLEQTTSEERRELDRMIEELTGKPCDEGQREISDAKLLFMLSVAKERVKKRRKGVPAYVA